MGWFSNAWKKVKKVFKKVTKAVKKVVKGVGNTAKKVWNKVKGTAKKFGQKISKLGPVANLAMNFIPGFGQLWAAYGVWGAMAKGAITGYLTSGGNVKGALLGAAGAYAGDWYGKLPGQGISEKMGNVFSGEMSFDKSYAKLAKGYTGRIGVDTTKIIPPSMRGQYAYSAPSISSIQGSYDANMASGMTSEATIAALNAQGARDAQYWINNPPEKTKKNKSLGDAVSGAISNFTSDSKTTLPFVKGSTEPLNQYQITAAGTKGEVGMGLDPNEQLIKQLGLTTLREKSLLDKQVFAA